MNRRINFYREPLSIHVIVALSMLGCTALAQAACVDNGDGTFTCSGTSHNIDNPTPMTGTVILDNASGATVLNNTTTDPEALSGQTTITNSTSTVGEASAITTNGSNAVTINNAGGRIILDGSGRTFNAAGWTNDANGIVYNDGVGVGMAAAISAGPGVSSLTVNNYFVDDGIFHSALFTTGINPFIGGDGPLSAAIYTNSPLLTVNSTGGMGTVYSFGGATYTPPSLLDGTQYATVTQAGTTTVTLNSAWGGIGSLYIVDRNPVLTEAQLADPSLVLAYGTMDVGPRNSLISVDNEARISNLYLGSGAHVVNVGSGFGGSNPVSNITVDQSDAEVIDVSGGVATTLYKIHGDRTFTYNSTNQYGPSNITLNDVAGAVNTLNVSGMDGNIFGNITANGLGANTLNMTCQGLSCAYINTIVGMTTINLMGTPAELQGSYSASGDINVVGSKLFLSQYGALSASNVVVDSSGHLDAPGNRITSKNQTMGAITGNLVNNGSVYLGDAALNVSGDATMNAGSHLGIGIGPLHAGRLDTAGNTNFASGSLLDVNIKSSVLVRDGASYAVAGNINGLPTILSDGGLVQWSPSNVAGELVLTADVGVPASLLPLISTSAANTTKALFSYAGSDPGTVKFMADLEMLSGPDMVSVVERLRPEINDGAIRMVLGNTDKLFNILDARTIDTYLASGNREAGVIPEEDPVTGKGIWVQGFGDRGSQDRLNGVDGYGLSSVGMAAGVDQVLDVDGNQRAGFAFGYARGNITNSGLTVNNRIDTSSYMAMAYASRAWDDLYVNGAIGFGRHVFDSNRQLQGIFATGSHDSWQIAGRLDAGMPFLVDDHLTVVPMTSLDYSHIRESGYRENAKLYVPLMDYSRDPPIPVYINSVAQYEDVNSPMNLQIGKRQFDSYRLGLGGKAIYSLQEPGWSAELEFHGMYRHEFGDLAQNSNARFVIGGDGFYSPGVNPVRDAIVLGGAVRMTGDDENDQMTLLTSYDADIREKYFGQTVSLNLRYDFDQGPRYLRQAAARKAAVLARQLPDQPVKATDRDIAAISQAMQPESVASGDQANPDMIAVDTLINNWINAQSNKNLDVYFNSYAANFVAPDGVTRQQWERKRKAEITREEKAALKVSYLTVKPNGDRAMAMFMQTSGEETVQKIVDLENRNGRWLIVREDSINLAQH